MHIAFFEEMEEDFLDAAVMIQETWLKQGMSEGISAGLLDTDAYDLGVKKVCFCFFSFCSNPLPFQGRELGREAGFVAGFCKALRSELGGDAKWKKIASAVEQMEKCLALIDWKDPSNETLSTNMDLMRAK